MEYNKKNLTNAASHSSQQDEQGINERRLWIGNLDMRVTEMVPWQASLEDMHLQPMKRKQMPRDVWINCMHLNWEPE